MNWREHCKKHHHRRIRWGVRNLSGTLMLCCIGDCDWEGAP